MEKTKPQKRKATDVPSDQVDLASEPRRSGRERRSVLDLKKLHDLEATADFARPPAKKRVPVDYKPADKGTVCLMPSALDIEDKSAPKRDTKGGLIFKDAPEFRPRLTPKQMLHSGVFGGCYMNPSGGKKGKLYPKGGIPIDYKEYPQDWFEGLDKSLYLSKRYYIPTNKYQVKAGADQYFWEESGWINPQDPRGWFQWYTRFYMGRRTEDDERQIKRWKNCTGEKGRWRRSLLNKIVNANAQYNDKRISPVIRQTLLHWAYEVDENDVVRHAKGK